MSTDMIRGAGLPLDLTLKGKGETYSLYDTDVSGTVRDITAAVATGKFRAFRGRTDLGDVRCIAVFEQGPVRETPRTYRVIWQWCESILVDPVGTDDSQEDTDE